MILAGPLSKLDSRQQLLVMGAGGLLLMAAGVRGVYLPLFARIRVQQTQLREWQAKAAVAAQLLSQRGTQETALKQAQQASRALESRIGRTPSLASFLERLGQRAKGARLELVAAQPKDAAASPRLIALGPQMQVREVPLTLQLTGRYRGLGEFLAALDREPVLFSIRHLTITKAQAEGAQVQADLLLHLYLPASAQAPASATQESVASELPVLAPSQQREAQAARAAALGWSRDPFVRGGVPGQVSGLTLSGILWDEAAPIAIINGEPVRAGDQVEGYRVVEITPERVSVSDETDTFQLFVTP